MTRDHEPFSPPDRPLRLESVEVSGRTVDEATERALSSLGAQRNQVEVEVLDEGSRGVLGIGAREAKVKVTLRSGRAEIVGAVAREMLALMGISAEVDVKEGPESIRVSVEGTNVGGLIGKHGQTLGAVEMLVALLAGRKAGGPVRIELDAEGYRERRETSLQDLARRTAERVARQGREIALTPMSPRDRRIVHVALQDHPKVSTVSRGEHDMRRVVVMPKGGRAASPDVGEEDHVGDPEEQPQGPPAGPGRQPEILPQRGAKGADHRAGSSRSRYPRRRSGDGRSGRGFTGYNQEGAPGRRGDLPGQRPAKGSRPEGLPVEEELEAEIEAYLAKTSGEKKADDSAPEPPEDRTKDE